MHIKRLQQLNIPDSLNLHKNMQILWLPASFSASQGYAVLRARPYFPHLSGRAQHSHSITVGHSHTAPLCITQGCTLRQNKNHLHVHANVTHTRAHTYPNKSLTFMLD